MNQDAVSAAVEAEGLARDGAQTSIPAARTAEQRAAARVDELLGAITYGVWSKEPAGTTALVLGFGLSVMIGFYLA
ncbi:cytochrome c oxidase subunit 4, partial [Streptomyces sp. NPDC002785]|uniref:aa3-type cytochrome oxidase subunit IV n=1 Tax=Streptomyces sp. NPDC002785 TaxID=3154543 RepID=UPI003324DCF3